MKICKRYISVFLCLVLCFTMISFNTEASQSEFEVGDIVDGSLLTNEGESTGTMQHINRGTYFADGISGISDYGNGLIYVNGTTNCNRTCSQIGLTLFVERLVNDSWVCVSQRSFSRSNNYYASGSYDLVVAKGYFYRVRGYHTASSNGVTESGWSQTSGVWIG